MNYRDFKEQNQNLLIVDNRLINQYPRPEYLRRQIVDWKSKNWLINLKRGLYTFNDKFVLAQLNDPFIANKLYFPSYVSLEWALSFYQLIPERVYTVTSVSSRKTCNFNNALGNFSYQTVKQDLFWGFNSLLVDPNNSSSARYLIASPEKALLDFFYLKRSLVELDPEYFDSLRLQNLDQINFALLHEYATKLGDTMISNLIELLEDYARSN